MFGWLGQIMAALAGVVSWLRALTPVIKIPLKIGLLITAFLVIPVPDWATSLPSKASGLPTTVQYMLYIFQVGFGVTVLAAAFVLRLAWNIVSGAIKGS